MARPRTKEQLLQASGDNFNKLFALIDSMSEEEQTKTFSFEDRDRNIRDVLVHLYEWHQLLLNWLRSNHAGNKTNFLPEPYNWKTYPKMNIEFWEKHQNTPLKKAVMLLKESHAEAMMLIERFSDEELFTSKYFSWTGNTSLGAYCVSSTSSHYDWAIKKIKKHQKTL
ncbi:ClbS/DfsB family four-helix bundle protein [Dysgonomonas sp. 25]|uniref:ClbS/DfsB family four-helix bundle protein n=1 Tax=Dysgonomonas sp. 25 TaxID=2302933 RepID=UPI0013D5AC83|nr:ClbS/DfsB family four-helix bundle protein [Dysgonomonas sp. 25]NDV67295.1 DfsB family protein [Dysgonomonas sp. 25]